MTVITIGALLILVWSVVTFVNGKKQIKVMEKDIFERRNSSGVIMWADFEEQERYRRDAIRLQRKVTIAILIGCVSGLTTCSSLR